MKQPVNNNRRTLIQSFGALSAATAAPGLVFGQDDVTPEEEVDVEVMETEEVEVVEVEEPELEKYGIRSYIAPEIRLDYWIDANGRPTEFSIEEFEGHSVNTQSAVRELQLRYDLPIVMGHDAGTEEIRHPLTMINYRTGGTPWLVLAAPDGTVVFNDFHADPDILIDFMRQYIS